MSPKDYETGYGKPPKATQFRKGRSGNPKGRPKGSRNFRTEVGEMLDSPVAVTENGRSTKVTTRMATLLRLREKALHGDARAMDRVLDLAKEMALEEDARSAERSLSGREPEILETFITAWIAAGKGGSDEK